MFILFTLASGHRDRTTVEPKVPDVLIPYCNLLHQTCCNDDEFQEMIESFDGDPFVIIDNARFINLSVLAIISPLNRERELWENDTI